MEFSKYELVSKEFENKGCKLLDTEEDFGNKQKNNRYPKYKYIASCNHEHEVFFNVFKNRGTGILCPKCIITRNSKNNAERIKNDKIILIRTEKQCIDHFTDMVKNDFECIKAFDGCKVDIILRIKNETNDKWLGIQVKSTNIGKKDYGFNLSNKDYTNYLILCICLDNKKMWLMPYNIVSGFVKITIGLNKSKYNIYEITPENFKEKIKEYYLQTQKFTFEELNKPNCIYQQREQNYRKYRESKLNFINFIYENMEGTVYDFIINGYKIQEKVGCVFKNGYLFNLCKNNGSKNKKRCFITYKTGDNDFYWLNCQDMRTFYIIPENELYNRNFLDKDKPKHIYFSNVSNSWYSQYKFDYENIDKEKIIKIFENIIN